MTTSPAGPCYRCNNSVPYTKFTCDFCGSRLPWADAGADVNGEQCPACQKKNAYVVRDCSGCGHRLPWADCAAARRAARTDLEGAEKSSITVIVVCIIAMFVGTMFVFYIVSPVS